MLRGYITGRLLEEGLIARPDDRGDAVLHLAPPLISGPEELDEMVAKAEAVLVDTSERFFDAGEAHGDRLLARGGRPRRARPAAGRRRRRRRRRPRRRLHGDVDGLAAAAARAGGARRAARGRRVRPRAERPQRRLRRDAVDEPARPGRPLRHRAGAGRGRGVERERRGDRRVVRGRGRRRVVPPGRVPARLGRRGAGRRAGPADRGGRAAGVIGTAATAPARALDPARSRGVAGAALARLPARGLHARRRDRAAGAARARAAAAPARARRADLRALARARAARRAATSSPRPPAAGCGRARRAGLNAATRGVRPLRSRLAVTSSHIVLTEPVPDVLERIGWTGGESITDGRTFVHYFRTTPDGRIAFGWGGGPLAFGARLNGRVERSTATARRDGGAPARAVPGARRAQAHARVGRADRRVARATCRRSGRCPTARSTTPSASPATASGRRIWPGGSSPGLALDARDEERGSRSSTRRRAPCRPSRSRGPAARSCAPRSCGASGSRRRGGAPDPLTRAVTPRRRRSASTSAAELRAEALRTSDRGTRQVGARDEPPPRRARSNAHGGGVTFNSLPGGPNEKRISSSKVAVAIAATTRFFVAAGGPAQAASLRHRGEKGEGRLAHRPGRPQQLDLPEA